MDGTSLNEIEKAKEEGKRPYQKVMLTVGAAVLGLVITLITGAVMGVFS